MGVQMTREELLVKLRRFQTLIGQSGTDCDQWRATADPETVDELDDLWAEVPATVTECSEIIRQSHDRKLRADTGNFLAKLLSASHPTLTEQLQAAIQLCSQACSKAALDCAIFIIGMMARA